MRISLQLNRYFFVISLVFVPSFVLYLSVFTWNLQVFIPTYRFNMLPKQQQQQTTKQNPRKLPNRKNIQEAYIQI